MIPILMGTDFYNLDGGFTNNQPIINDHTIKVNLNTPITIYIDTSKDDDFILSYPMYIHIIDNKDKDNLQLYLELRGTYFKKRII